MEEDIKILEEFEMFCEDMYYFVDDDMGGHFKAVIGDQKANTMLGYFKLKRMLKNLINRNKELEDMLKNRIKYTNELEKDLFENASNYVVPKSVIREKIEELKNRKKELQGIECNSEAIEILEIRINDLQELLEREGK